MECSDTPPPPFFCELDVEVLFPTAAVENLTNKWQNNRAPKFHQLLYGSSRTSAQQDSTRRLDSIRRLTTQEENHIHFHFSSLMEFTSLV